MNFGIINNRRPEKNPNKLNPLLNDVRMREIAKQMGLEPKDFGKEAQNIWNMLDDMAQNDPKAYQEFIHAQLKDGPPPPQNNQTEHKKPTYFTPYPGFVIKCMMTSPTSTKLFLNICAHDVIDMPKNPNSGRRVPADTRSVPTTNNLQLPLVIGALREMQDCNQSTCRAIDVIFHPWVLERCAWDANFKKEVMKLAMYWVQNDAKVKLDATAGGKFIKSKYKGGVALGKEILTSKFHIEPMEEDQESNNKKPQQKEEATNSKRPTTNRIRMESPSDLLKQMSLQESSNQNEEETMNLRLSTNDNQQQETETTKPKKKLIEVIEPTPKPAKPTEETRELAKATAKATEPKKKPTSSVVKKGFLNAKKTELYPTGSSEGRPASAYVRLMSRSKVVDMNDMEKQRKAQDELAKERQDAFSFLQPTDTKRHEDNDCGDFEFDQLCQEADPDFVPQSQRGKPNDATQARFGDQLDEFAKFLTSQS